ncbi:hypothetical protein E3P99_01167 [Wallemia hederae]|uniref:FHF complex subunit HOOK-interacting protein C-terminal domain-containing protein n=1 Tax=Wallemia hederae TaxID=1540922 RepID=A0A4T0FRX0_9BASI|nr:hypothetical protein E3P99_01167 [Wallemia hederae]
MEANWIAIQDTLTTPDERQLLRGIHATDVPKRLNRIVDTLVLETGRYEDIQESPPALDWFLSQARVDVLSKLVNLSAADRPFGIKTQVLKAVSNLCVTMQSHFFVQAPVHKPLVQLLKICTGDDTPSTSTDRVLGAASSAATSQPSEYEEHLVDLLCILCNKIKSSPSLLHIFFLDRSWSKYPTRSRASSIEDHSERPLSPASATTITSRAISAKPDSEFLIFTYLLRWVHREGRTGDLARAAILILFEVSTSEDVDSDAQNQDTSIDIRAAVADFIVDGDLAEVLAAGLGAVYGILPTNLAVIPTDVKDRQDKSRAHLSNKSGLVESVELSTNIAFQNQLWVFISVFEFTAEITKRGLKGGNKYGVAVAHNVLEAVRINFFANVLYPSILECSSTDYSAVAVMSYLEVMLRGMKSGDPLADTLLQYLFAEDDSTQHEQDTSMDSQRKTKKHDRRRSTALVLLQNESAAQTKSTDYISSYGRFTLKDLITINLKSSNSASKVAAMKLFSYLMFAYDVKCLKDLVNVLPQKDATAFPYFHQIHALMKDKDHYRKLEEKEEAGEHVFPIPPPMRNANVNTDELTGYLGLVGSIDAQTTQEMLSTGYERYLDDAQALIVSHPQFKLASKGGISSISSPSQYYQPHHKFDMEDAIIKLVLESLANFFVQSPDTNIALSGVLAALAANPCRSLEGFITSAWVDEDDPYSDASEATKAASTSTSASTPAVLTILTDLVSQIDDYRLQARNNISSQDLDHNLKERRKGMLFKENLEDALALLDDIEPAQRNDLVRQFEDGVGRAVLKMRNKRSNQQRKKTYGEINKISHKRYQDSIDTEFEKRVQRNNSWGISNLTAKADEFIRQPRARSATSSLAALFTSNKKGAAKEDQKQSQRQRQVSAFEGPATPFYDHYKQTEQCLIIPKAAEVLPERGATIPEDNEKENEVESDDAALKQAEHSVAVKPITLSEILENVVILEEMLKDLVAIIQIRRSIGIDLVCIL